MTKKIVLVIAILLLAATHGFGQNNRKAIKALKTGFITNALALTPQEAEKFWPVYNQYDDRIHQVKTVKTRELSRKILAAGGIDKLSDAEANQVLEAFIDIDFKVARAKQQLHKDLSGIISSKKFIKLLRAEQAFNKELLKKLRERRNINSIKRN